MRRLAITKRLSLEGIADGWGSECYALVSPASYAEYIEFAGLSDEGKSNTELLQFQLDFVKKHLVSGKVNVINDANETVLDDLLPEDIDASKELADKLFAEIVGVSLDPKASSTETATSETNAATTTL